MRRVLKGSVLCAAVLVIFAPLFHAAFSQTVQPGRRDYPDPDFSKTVVKEGSPTLQIKVTGIGYFQRSVVYFNGIPVPTRFVNANELQAQVDESLLRAPGRYALVVRNAGAAAPQKLGDGSSNRGWLIVGYR